MASAFDLVLGSLGDDGLSTIADQLGTDSKGASDAVSQALPLLLGALSHNASSDTGAESLLSALTKDHDGSALDNPTQAMLSDDGPKILGHVFGENEPQAAQLLGSKSGIGASGATKLMMMLAPLLLSALGRKMRSGNASTGSLQEELERDTSEATQAGGSDILGGLGDILGGVLGGGGGGGGGGAGALGSILGKVLGR